MNKDLADVRLGCDNAVHINMDFNNPPQKIKISYVGINELVNFLNSENGYKIKNFCNNQNTKLIIYPTDSLCLGGDDYDNFMEIVPFLRSENVIFYQSWYNEYTNFNHYCGTHIHSALNNFISYYDSNNIDLNEKEKHFLTLNNRWNLAREELFEFYDTLEFDLKNKFYVSFNFKNIFINNVKDIEDFYSNHILKYYDNSLIEIITESHYDSITEKSYKPIIAGIPFIYWRIGSNFGQKDTYFSQLNYFKNIGIDLNYFDINYENSDDAKDKIKEILNLSKEEVLQNYKIAFEKALNNKKIILNHLFEIQKNII